VVDGSENGGNGMRIYRWVSPKGQVVVLLYRQSLA